MSEFRSEQAELHGIKEITLATPVPTDHGICSRREGLDFTLLAKRPEIRQRDLLDMHGCCSMREASSI
jgi:hypothetical protein